MKLSKNQIVLAAIGGVTVVAAGILGYLAFAANGENSELADSLDSAESGIRRLLNAEIAPTAKSVVEISSNATALTEWRDETLLLASDGDRSIVSDMNEAAFKQKLVEDARALSALPGGVDGAIVAKDFTFGFASYIAGGELPDHAMLPLLQRQWTDISIMVKLLSKCSVIELTKVEALNKKAPTVAAENEEDKSARKQKSKAKKKGKAADEAKPVVHPETYELEFRANPASLVRVLNAFTVDNRFFVVDSFGFARENDMIMSAIGTEKEKNAQNGNSGGRRRRRAAKEEPVTPAEGEETETQKKGLVNDPAHEAPFLVKMTVTSYDFGSGDHAKESEPEAAAPEADGNAQDESEQENAEAAPTETEAAVKSEDKTEPTKKVETEAKAEDETKAESEKASESEKKAESVKKEVAE